jgi:hypothetical protein
MSRLRIEIPALGSGEQTLLGWVTVRRVVQLNVLLFRNFETSVAALTRQLQGPVHLEMALAALSGRGVPNLEKGNQ